MTLAVVAWMPIAWRRAGVRSGSSWRHAREGPPDVVVEAASLHAPSSCSWQILTGSRGHPRLGWWSCHRRVAAYSLSRGFPRSSKLRSLPASLVAAGAASDRLDGARGVLGATMAKRPRAQNAYDQASFHPCNWRISACCAAISRSASALTSAEEPERSSVSAISTAPPWWVRIIVTNPRSNWDPVRVSSQSSCPGASRPGTCGRSCSLAAPAGAGRFHRVSQACMMRISASWLVMILAASFTSSGRRLRPSTSLAMSMACWWWGIMSCRNMTSASLKAGASWAASWVAAPRPQPASRIATTRVIKVRRTVRSSPTSTEHGAVPAERSARRLGPGDSKRDGRRSRWCQHRRGRKLDGKWLAATPGAGRHHVPEQQAGEHRKAGDRHRMPTGWPGNSEYIRALAEVDDDRHRPVVAAVNAREHDDVQRQEHGGTDDAGAGQSHGGSFDEAANARLTRLHLPTAKRAAGRRGGQCRPRWAEVLRGGWLRRALRLVQRDRPWPPTEG